jgi:hypothetical protein
MAVTIVRANGEVTDNLKGVTIPKETGFYVILARVVERLKEGNK